MRGISRQPACFCYSRVIKNSVQPAGGLQPTRLLRFAMIPYLHPEFVEALTSQATDKSAKDTSPDVSPRPLATKRKDRLVLLRRIPGRLRSLIVAVAAKLILLLIHVCL